MTNKVIRSSMIIIVLAIIAIGLITAYQKKKQSIAFKLPGQVTIDTKNQPVLGNTKAAVKIVAFEDLKCMMCKVYNVGLYQQIKKQFIDTGKASYTVMNVAFIPGSINAAMTARCLYEQKPSYFFQFVDYVYHHQGLENENWTTIPNMLADAAKIPGVDNIRLGVCVTTANYTKLINQNLEQASKLMGGTVKTPSIYVNGILVSPLTMEQFKQVINMVS